MKVFDIVESINKKVLAIGWAFKAAWSIIEKHRL
jgi:hypothetical protein